MTKFAVSVHRALKGRLAATKQYCVRIVLFRYRDADQTGVLGLAAACYVGATGPMPLCSERRRTVSTSVGSPSAIFLLGFALLSVSCSGDAKDSPTPEMTTAGFKSATVDNQSAGPGFTVLVTLPFTAPSDGFVSVSATGSCAVAEPLPVSSFVAVGIEPTPTDRTPHPGDGTFLLGGGNNGPTLGSFAVMRVLAVPAGENVVHLVVDNPSSGGLLACSASLLAMFESHQLP